MLREDTSRPSAQSAWVADYNMQRPRSSQKHIIPAAYTAKNTCYLWVACQGKNAANGRRYDDQLVPEGIPRIGFSMSFDCLVDLR
jgi:hypothetical protein